LAGLLLLTATASAQNPTVPEGGVRALYRRMAAAGLDRNKVFHIRDGAIDREDLHLSFNDGTLGFMQATDGTVDGLFFAGEGEVLVVPPNHTERQSLALFTRSAVLSEKFSVAYLRFSDSQVLRDLAPSMLPAENPEEFVQRYGAVVKNLAPVDALRLTVSRVRARSPEPAKPQIEMGEFIRARLTGGRFGTFDVVLDTAMHEQVLVGQSSQTENGVFYDQWMTFPMRSARAEPTDVLERTVITDYEIKTDVQPPTSISSEATLKLTTVAGGERLLLFELSRNLKVSSVTLEGTGPPQPLEVLQNEPIEGSQQQRLGNDIVAVALPSPLTDGQKFTLRFRYAGPVMSDAGGGLMYVGSRGVWYPNRGLWMSNFNLEFRTPIGWKLLATGSPVSHVVSGEQEVTQWRSQRPIPVAGFNLGRYIAAAAKASSGTVVDCYAAESMDDRYKQSTISRAVTPMPRPWWGRRGVVDKDAMAASTTMPNPARNAQAVAEQAAQMIDFLAPRIGAFPFDRLSLTQIPGTDSQGWPGLVYLSSYVFLNPQERWRDRVNEDSPDEILFRSIMTAHETAHQWWGDAVFWKTYRDQWMMEALANYSALLKLESEDPVKFRLTMTSYRDLLLQESNGRRMKDAGAVTLGGRLNSSKFPDSYDVIAYGRGTWLLHMIRHMLRDGQSVESKVRTRRGQKAAPEETAKDPDALFFSFLRSLREGYEGKVISTPDFQRILEEMLPPNLRFEGRPSLDWFFDGWVGGVAVPKLQLEQQKVANTPAGATATALLRQDDAPELLVTSVPIYAQGKDGSLRFVRRVFADGAETQLRLKVPSGTVKLVVDPYRTVLRAE